MKKTIRFGFTALVAVMVIALAGCPGTGPGDDPGDGGDPGHTHSYSTEWSYNATHHWHECTAGDGAKADEAAHDGATPCSVCGYDSTYRLQIPASLLYGTDYNDEDETYTVTDPLGDVTGALDEFIDVAVGYPVSDHFIGSAAVTNGKITIDLTPKESELFRFSYTYPPHNSTEEICDPNAKGIMFTYFMDDVSYWPGLVKTDGSGLATHEVIFIYIDRDLTFTNDTYYHKLKGLSVEKGWNYFSQNISTKVCEVITDLSGYQWVNYD